MPRWVPALFILPEKLRGEAEGRGAAPPIAAREVAGHTLRHDIQ